MSSLRHTIGLLVDTLGEDYQGRLFAGLNDAAAARDVDVICFIGGPLSAVGPAAQRNRIYDSALGGELDGVVVASGTLGNQVGTEALNAFVESFAPLPTCSVGIEVPSCPSVRIDNRAGVREALVHLITEVGRRRIAFICGPEANREAAERFEAYRDVLAEHRLSIDPDLVTLGDFEAASGARAVATLIDERRMGFDAIMAASDLMALGALNALSERGVAVPDRVSVVGFDDIEAARYATSPLTTVRQPLIKLGMRALELVADEIEGHTQAGQSVLPAGLIRRQSSMAGQEHRAPLDSLRSAGTPDSASFEQAYRNVRARLFEELREEVPLAGIDGDWPEQLCNSFVSEASGRSPGLLQRSTLEHLENLLLRVVESHGDANSLQAVISRMRTRLRPIIQNNIAIANRAEDLWHRCRVLIGGIAERYQVQHRLQRRHWRRTIVEIGAELLRAESIYEVRNTLSGRLPSLGIPACAVCAFESAESSRLLAAYDTSSQLRDGDATFDRRRLLPGDLLRGGRRRTLVVESLYVNERALGYVVFEMGPPEPVVYEQLRDYLTGALRGLL